MNECGLMSYFRLVPVGMGWQELDLGQGLLQLRATNLSNSVQSHLHSPFLGFWIPKVRSLKIYKSHSELGSPSPSLWAGPELWVMLTSSMREDAKGHPMKLEM